MTPTRRSTAGLRAAPIPLIALIAGPLGHTACSDAEPWEGTPTPAASTAAPTDEPTDTEPEPTAPFVSGADVVINELLAKNDATNVDEAGDHDDWVELYNRGDAAADLSGWGLSDDPEAEAPWQLPEGTQLEPGAFLLIWCDEDDDGPLHADFKLSADGESVTLWDASGALADQLTFGALAADVSWGRLADGGSELGEMTPSPGASNR